MSKVLSAVLTAESRLYNGLLPVSSRAAGHLRPTDYTSICTWTDHNLPFQDLKDMVRCEGLGWNFPFGRILQQRQNTFPRSEEKSFRHLASPNCVPNSRSTTMNCTSPPSSSEALSSSLHPLNLPMTVTIVSYLCHLQRANSKRRVRWAANRARWKARCRKMASGRKRQFTVHWKRN